MYRPYPNPKRATFALGLTSLALGSWMAHPANAQTPPTAPPAPPDTAAPAPEQAPTPPNYGWQISGLIDGYYQFQFSNPKFPGKPNTLGAPRVYDVRHNAPTIALGELNIFRNARPGGFGFKTTLITGDVADINHGNFPPGGPTDGKNESRFKNVQQLYGTYAFSGAGGGIDFGKYYTPFGYEVTESNGNYNYSRSLAFNMLPFYHMGLRAYTPSLHGLTVTGYVFNALFNTATAGVEDDNSKPAGAVQLNYTPTGGKYVAITTWGFGKDKFGGTDTKVTLGDTDFTYNFNASSLMGLNYVYSRQSPDGGGRTTANGYAAYYKQTLTPKTGYAVRFSGVRSSTTGAPKVRPYEATLTYEMKPKTNLLTRVEYRHDWNNVATYLDKDSNATKKSQDTLTLSGVYTF